MLWQQQREMTDSPQVLTADPTFNFLLNNTDTTQGGIHVSFNYENYRNYKCC